MMRHNNPTTLIIMSSEEEVPCSLPLYRHHAGNRNLHVAEINNIFHSNDDTECNISINPTAVDDEAVTEEPAAVNDEAVTTDAVATINESLANYVIVFTQTRVR